MSRLLSVLIAIVAGAAAQPAGADPLQPVRVADAVYVFVGDAGEIGPGNRGEVANSGFIVGRDGVIVVDTGISARYGQAMVDAIRRVTDRPIALVVITHAEQEFLFGAAAFESLRVPILTHARSAELMRQRCERCLQNLTRLLGAEAMAGTRLVIPRQTVGTSTPLEVAGRHIELLHYGWGSTPGDLIVYDPASGALFAGGLVTNRRVPELRDAQLEGWLRALRQLDRVGAGIIVPGFGPPGGHELILATSRYLSALDVKVTELYRGGASLLDAVDRADLPEYASWGLYPSLHRQNALHRYLQLELQELGGG